MSPLSFADNRTAERSAELCARKSRFERRERIARLNAFVADKAENISAVFVCAAFGDDVDDAARGASEFRRVGIGRHLIFLHGFLRNGRARGVDRIVGKIRTVNLHERRASALSADVQTGSRRRSDRTTVVASDGRNRQCKSGRAAFVDRQIFDSLLVNRVGNRSCASFRPNRPNRPKH